MKTSLSVHNLMFVVADITNTLTNPTVAPTLTSPALSVSDEIAVADRWAGETVDVAYALIGKNAKNNLKSTAFSPVASTTIASGDILEVAIPSSVLANKPLMVAISLSTTSGGTRRVVEIFSLAEFVKNNEASSSDIVIPIHSVPPKCYKTEAEHISNNDKIEGTIYGVKSFVPDHGLTEEGHSISYTTNGSDYPVNDIINSINSSRQVSMTLNLSASNNSQFQTILKRAGFIFNNNTNGSFGMSCSCPTGTTLIFDTMQYACDDVVITSMTVPNLNTSSTGEISIQTSKNAPVSTPATLSVKADKAIGDNILVLYNAY